MSDVTVLGLGNMGRAVAGAFLRAGLDVVVWNRTPGRADDLKGSGAHVAASPSAAVAASPLVVLALLDHPSTVSTLEGMRLGSVRWRHTFVQLAVGGPEDARDLARRVNELGGEFLDAHIRAYPGTVGSEEAQLNVSGDPAVLERHSDVLGILGRVDHISDDVALGAHLNNAQAALMECMVVAFLETLSYALAAGVPLQTVVNALPQTFSLAQQTMHDSAKALGKDSLGRVRAEKAALGVHAHGLAQVVRAMATTGSRTDLTSATLAVLSEATRAGLAGCEISALLAVYGQQV